MEYTEGKKYKLYRDGEYIGRATWTNDKHNGYCFLIETFVEGFGLVNQVVFDDVLAIEEKD